MHRISVLLVLFLLLFGSTMIALAQDPTSEPPVSVVKPPANVVEKQEDSTTPAPAAPLIDPQTIVLGILATIVMFDKYTNGGIVKLISSTGLIPSDKAKEWYDAGVKAGIHQALVQALKTPGKEDDERAYQLAKDAGYRVVIMEDGNPVLVKIAAAPPAEPRTFIQESAA